MDSKPLTFSRALRNDRPTQNEWDCECGGVVYAVPSAQFASCTGGEVRCTTCRRPARRFRGGLTCGVGCVAV